MYTELKIDFSVSTRANTEGMKSDSLQASDILPINNSGSTAVMCAHHAL